MDFMSHIGGLNVFRPTFFELAAQEQMVQLLRPAFTFALEVFALRSPALRVVDRYADEVYALITLLVEKSYLDTSDGTFGESLFGLRRGKSRLVRATDRLTPRDRRRALAIQVIVPYLLAKLDAYYEKERAAVAAVPITRPADEQMTDAAASRSAIAAAAKRAFLRAYPFVHAGYHALLFAYHFLYAFGRTPYFSPWLQLLGQEIKRVSLKDLVRWRGPPRPPSPRQARALTRAHRPARL